MDRAHVAEQLSLYVDGMLSPGEAEAVRRHLAGCEACRAELAALQQTLALLRSLPEEDPPGDLTASIMARVRAEAAGAGGRARFSWSRRWGVGAAAAAVLVLLVAGLIADRMRDGELAFGNAGGQEAVTGFPTAGAGVSPGTDAMAPAPAAMARMAADGDLATTAPPSPPTTMAGSGAGDTAPAVLRRVIHSANLVLRVDNVESAYDQVILLVESAGGFAQEASLSDAGPDIILPPRERPAGEARKVAYLVLRVPTSRFQAFTSDVLALGEPRTFRTNASDITAEYVDVEARLRNLQAKESRLLEIVAGAETVEDLLAVEREIWQVRGEIESLQARLNTWNQLLDLATLNLTLEPAGVSPPVRDKGTLERLLLAVYRAVDYLVVGLETMIIGAGVVLPWAVLAGIAWFIYRRRPRGGSPAAP